MGKVCEQAALGEDKYNHEYKYKYCKTQISKRQVCIQSKVCEQAALSEDKYKCKYKYDKIRTQIFKKASLYLGQSMGAGGLGRGEGKLKVTKRKYSLTSSFTLLEEIRYKIKDKKIRNHIRYI